jgi:predicted RNA binding protein YcfA (HicA-like mRNA interferase family)
VRRRRLLDRLLRGSLNNVSFVDACDLVEGLGFRLKRTKGSHHIFVHPHLPERLNLQNVHGEAKPYQLRQLIRLIRRYPLHLEDNT